MYRLRVKHVTGFTYAGDVTASYNEARMLPVSGEGQFVLFSGLEITPMSSSHSYVDYWGTRVNSFEILTAHRELSLTATSLVEVDRGFEPPAAEELGWEDLHAESAKRVETMEQIAQTPLTDPPSEVQELARRAAATMAPADAALEICAAIAERVDYVQGVTGVHTTARAAWREGRGVCQDITHLAIGALRSIGVPARYVSGYLHPQPEAPVGEAVVGESHAWIEWFCGGWRGWDPTNRSGIGDGHVFVGRGRDYADVPPLRGVYAGPSRGEVFVNVEITREA